MALSSPLAARGTGDSGSSAADVNNLLSLINTPSLFKAWQAQQETAANAKAGEGGHTKEKKDDEEKKKKEKEEESWKEQ